MQRRNERFVERLPLVLPRPVYGYALSLLLCMLAWLARVAAETLLPVGYPFVTFFPAVILSSFLFGVRPGIFAAVIGGLLSWYCFIPPAYALAFNPGVDMALIYYTMVVAVDIDQPLDHRVGQYCHRREKAQIARLCGQLRDPVAQQLLVVGGDGAQAYDRAVVQRAMHCDVRDRLCSPWRLSVRRGHRSLPVGI